MMGLEQELMEVRQTLENRHKEYVQRKKLLEPDNLAYIAPYEERLHIKGEMAELVERSKREAVRKRRRLLMVSATVVGLILVIVSGLGITSYLNFLEAKEQREIAVRRAVEAERQKTEAEYNLGLMFNEKAERALKDAKPTSFRLYAAHALAKLWPDAPQRASLTGQLLQAADYPTAYISPLGIKHHTDAIISVAFSPDGRTLASGSETLQLLRLGDTDTTLSVHEAEDLYHLRLEGLELKPIPPESNLYGAKAHWSKNHPLHWLPAAEKGDGAAMAQLGLIYPRDGKNEKALEWYQKAADAGNAYGKERLAFLKKWLQSPAA
ncbi:MAG: hypothetical protein GY731_04190 [Gammaproteobacteria bacterium]|nr:hypothetical protein [Gammaproteobacteria bacterium]